MMDRASARPAKRVAAAADARDVVAKSAALAPWLGQNAARIEAAQKIPEDVAERLVDTGVFRLMQPRRYGGFSASPRFAWEAVFEIARGCASCAWIAGLTSANILMLGKFSDQAQRDVFLDDRPAIVPVLTGGVGRDIDAERAPGGLVLSGTWRYASGIDIASWVGLLIGIPDCDNRPEPHLVLVPKEEFAIDHESWKVLGMRGTGSKTVTLRRTPIPEHRWMSWAVLQSGGKHSTSANDEAVYRFPLNCLFAMSVLAPMLGVASAVAEEFTSIVASRISSGTQQHQIGDKLAHVDVATGSATMAMLRQVLLGDTDAIEHEIAIGASLSIEARALARMKIALASRQALATTQRLFSSIGGSLLPEGTRIERLFRDLHAMSSHFLLQPEPIGEAYGRLLLGLELPPGARL
jgi:alkylation response protein AidB-like acyl-CoA dehydrogenase